MSGGHTSDAPALVADIGGTNARFALVETASGGVLASERVHTADFPGPVAAARAVLDRIGAGWPAPRRAAWAVACPVTGDRVALTNHTWSFSIAEARAALDLDVLRVINDFAANALAIPALTGADRVRIGPDVPGDAAAPIAALGPGTWLGVALLLPDGAGGWRVQATEGGHVTLAPADADEARLIAYLWRTHDHVSAERLVSGPGLLTIHQALRALDPGTPGAADCQALDHPRAITEAAGAGNALAHRAVMTLFAILGTVAGNLVLSTGARGGVHILGGIVPETMALFRESPFRARFEAKGRFADYMRAVPTHVVTRSNPAFLGLSQSL